VSSRGRRRPRIPFEPINRERLVSRLLAATRRRVAIIAAPAGFGKSTAIRQFVERRASVLAVIKVRRASANPQSFLEALIRALEECSATATTCHTQTRSIEDVEAQVKALMETALAKLARSSGVLVIDDLHLAHEPSVKDLIIDMVDLTPPNIHWLLAIRSISDLPVATWLAQGVSELPADEGDLRFTPTEVRNVADSWQLDLDDDAWSMLDSFAGGWPAATSLMLAALVTPEKRQEALVCARDLFYSYLDHEVFSPLDCIDRQFLLDTCLLPELDVDVLRRAGYDTAASTLIRMQGQTALITHVSDRIYRYQEYFGKFLRFKLELGGAAAFRAALRKTAEIFESGLLLADALATYAEAQDFDSVERVLVEHGRALIDLGFIEETRKQLFSRQLESKNDRIELLGLRAEVLEKLGRFDASNAIFASAISRCRGDQRAEFAQRAAVSLINQYRHLEACRVLASIAPSSITNSQLKCRVGATLAAAQSASGKHKLATRSMGSALDLACHLNDPSLEASVLNSAAFVSIRGGKLERAREYATRSVAVALESRLHDVAARAYSTLVSVSSEVGDQEATRENCLRMLNCAEQAGDRAVQRVALMGLCDLAAESGDEIALAQLEARLDRFEGRSEPRWHETLLPAKAMQLAWRGQYREACDLLADSAYSHANVEQQFLRRTEIALYSAAAGQWESAKLKLEEIEALESTLGEDKRFSNRVVKASLLMAITCVLIGRPRQSVERLRTLERRRLLKTSCLYSLWRVAMIFSANSGGGANAEFERAVLDLRANGMGGFALLINSLADTRRGILHKFSALTPTEMRILRTLTKGRTTKSIARELDRSPGTIDTHVKAIVRKLGCEGRIEAAQIAREHGLV
jgi:ATP/maltotriose-dependent transcriptional regulator MalT